MRDRNGFSLVEVMIALVVVLLVSLAMMQTALVSIDSNMLNALRDEAVSLAEERMNADRNLARADSDFDNFLVTDGAAVLVSRNVRNVKVAYSAQRTVVGYPNLASALTKDVTERVSWTWKGQGHSYSGRTLLKRPG